MEKLRKLFVLFFTCSVAYVSYAQPKIIFDTDFGGDADDLGALAMLHNFVDKGECDLLAVMSWSTEMYTVSAIDAVNTFYGHPNVPIGTRKDSNHFQAWNYSKPISDQFPFTLDHNKVPDAIVLYRKLLAASADKSVVIVTVGPLKNIENLLNSMPDTISNLNGVDLVEKKVKEFVIMGGQYPEGPSEWNFNGDMKNVTKNVIEAIPVPITFSGYELGVDIKTGEVFNTIDKNTPLYVGFMHFSAHAPWIKEHFNGDILDNSTYDQTAVMYAVRGGIEKYWEKVAGTCLPDEKGGNKWEDSNNGNHSYLKLIVKNEDMATLIESIMLGIF